MTDLAKLVVKLEAQSAQYIQQLDAANKKLSSFERNQNAILGKINKGFGAVKGVLALAGLTFSIGAVIKATAEAEEAFALLKNAVDASGGAAGRTAEQLADTAASLQKITTFDDEAIMGMQQLLPRFQSIQGVNFDNAQKSILDMSAALRIDLATAAQLVGKSLEMPEKGMNALAKKGITFTEEQQKVIKALLDTGRKAEAQGIMLDALGKKYAGAAEAVRNTFGGALTGLKNAFNDLLEGKSGVNDATKAINELSNTLASPEIQKGFATLLGGFFKATGAIAGFLAKAGDFATWVGESFAAQAYGPRSDDLVRYGDAIEELRKDIVRFENESAVRKWMENQADPKSIGLPEGTKNNHDAVLANMRARLASMERQYAEQSKALAMASQQSGAQGGAGAGGGGGSSIEVASEQFTKLKEKLEEQIALYDKTGEAAKIAYQIAHDQLEDLSPKEEKELLALARQYDAIVKKAEATKVAEAAQKELQQNYDKEVENLTKAAALTSEVTELERIRYEINSGGLKGITEGQQEVLENLARQADLLKTNQAFDSQLKALKEQAALTGEVTELERVRYEMLSGDLSKVTEQQRFALESAAVDADLARERAKIQAEVKSATEATLTPLEKYQETIAALNKLMSESNALLGAGGLSQEAYARAVAQAQKDLDEASKNIDTFFNRVKQNTQSILGDGIYKVMNEGFSKGAKSALDSFIHMIDQMVAQALAADLNKALFGGSESGGGSGGFLGKALSFGKSLFGGSRDSGGRGTPGKAYAIGMGAQPELFVPDVPGNFYPANQWGGGASGQKVEQNIYVQGTVDTRTASQIANEASKRQRIAARLT